MCQGTIFQGATDFGFASIGGKFIAKESKFFHEKEGANFNSMKVGQSAFFDKATFQGSVNFASVEIDRQFSVKEGQFLHEKKRPTSTL